MQSTASKNPGYHTATNDRTSLKSVKTANTFERFEGTTNYILENILGIILGLKIRF